MNIDVDIITAYIHEIYKHKTNIVKNDFIENDNYTLEIFDGTITIRKFTINKHKKLILRYHSNEPVSSAGIFYNNESLFIDINNDIPSLTLSYKTHHYEFSINQDPYEIELLIPQELIPLYNLYKQIKNYKMSIDINIEEIDESCEILRKYINDR